MAVFQFLCLSLYMLFDVDVAFPTMKRDSEPDSTTSTLLWTPGDIDGIKDSIKKGIGKSDNTVRWTVGMYIAAHKYFSVDYRVAESQILPEDLLFYKQFPTPPLETNAGLSELKAACDADATACVNEVLQKALQSGSLRNFKKNQNSKKPIYAPFDNNIGMFDYRQTAMNYLCWYTLKQDDSMRYMDCKWLDGSGGASCLEYLKQVDEMKLVGKVSVNDIRDEAFREDPFLCPRLWFCPDPCYGRNDWGNYVEENFDSSGNPCGHFENKECHWKMNGNTNFDGLINNEFNVSCSQQEEVGFNNNTVAHICERQRLLIEKANEVQTTPGPVPTIATPVPRNIVHVVTLPTANGATYKPGDMDSEMSVFTGNIANLKLKISRRFRKSDNTALWAVGMYIAAHKYFGVDYRVAESVILPEDLLFYKEFPSPPVEEGPSVSALKAACETEAATCVNQVLQEAMQSGTLKNFMQTSSPKLPLYAPFNNEIEMFEYRQTAMNYLCWHALNKEESLSYMDCSWLEGPKGVSCLEFLSSVDDMKKVGNVPVIDIRDKQFKQDKFLCARLWFCPDPCYGRNDWGNYVEDNFDSSGNPCGEFENKECNWKTYNGSTDFDALIRNNFNFSCFQEEKETEFDNNTFARICERERLLKEKSDNAGASHDRPTTSLYPEYGERTTYGGFTTEGPTRNPDLDIVTQNYYLLANIDGIQTSIKAQIGRHDNIVLWVVGMYIAAHKYFGVDYRVAESEILPEDLTFYKQFPSPPLALDLGALEANTSDEGDLDALHRACQADGADCVREVVQTAMLSGSLQHLMQATPLRPLYAPFSNTLDMFEYRQTAMYYLCWHTLKFSESLRYMDYDWYMPGDGVSCLEHLHSVEDIKQAGNQTIRDLRDGNFKNIPYLCPQLWFCPDPCYGSHDFGNFLEENYNSQGNPCGHLRNKECEWKAKKNRNLEDLIKNKFNISCSCSRQPGYEWDNGTCVDTDECSENTHNCPELKVCKNTDGGYECKCPIGMEGCDEAEMEEQQEEYSESVEDIQAQIAALSMAGVPADSSQTLTASYAHMPIALATLLYVLSS